MRQNKKNTGNPRLKKDNPQGKKLPKPRTSSIFSLQMSIFTLQMRIFSLQMSICSLKIEFNPRFAKVFALLILLFSTVFLNFSSTFYSASGNSSVSSAPVHLLPTDKSIIFVPSNARKRVAKTRAM